MIFWSYRHCGLPESIQRVLPTDHISRDMVDQPMGVLSSYMNFSDVYGTQKNGDLMITWTIRGVPRDVYSGRYLYHPVKIFLGALLLH